MTGLSLAIAHAVKLALLAALVGVVARGRVRLCWAFPAYVLTVLLANCLVSFWPLRFHTPGSWVVFQGAFDLLKMLLVLELAWRAFAVFPGALRSARLVLFSLLGASTVLIALFTPPSSYATVWNFQSSVVTGTLWLLTATALLVVWYQIPVHDWQRAIMLGLAPYLLVFVASLDILRRHGWAASGTAGLLDQLGYLALIVFWAWAAWRRDSAGTIPAEKAA
jgi:hypothetical protein